MTVTASSALQDALTRISPSIRVEDRALFVDGELTFEEAEQVGQVLFGFEDVSRFAVGDFLNHCEDVFRDEWTQLLSERLGSRATTIENWRYTCRNVHPDIRRADLGITAHYGVAKLVSKGLQVQLLRIAAESEMSSKDVGQFASLFKDMSAGEQYDWGQRMEQENWGSQRLLDEYKAMLLNAHSAASVPTTTADEDEEVPFAPMREPSADNAPAASLPRLTRTDKDEEVEYSGERSDYDWSEQDDYDPDEEEKPGDLVALQVALEELYFSTTGEEYSKHRYTLMRLLEELDGERIQLYQAGQEEFA